MRQEPQTAYPSPYTLLLSNSPGKGWKGMALLALRPCDPVQIRLPCAVCACPLRERGRQGGGHRQLQPPRAALSRSTTAIWGQGSYSLWGRGPSGSTPSPCDSHKDSTRCPVSPPTAKWPSMETHLVLEALTDGLQISLVNSQFPLARGCRPAGWRPRCSGSQG